MPENSKSKRSRISAIRHCLLTRYFVLLLVLIIENMLIGGRRVTDLEKAPARD